MPKYAQRRQHVNRESVVDFDDDADGNAEVVNAADDDDDDGGNEKG